MSRMGIVDAMRAVMIWEFGVLGIELVDLYDPELTCNVCPP